MYYIYCYKFLSGLISRQPEIYKYKFCKIKFLHTKVNLGPWFLDTVSLDHVHIIGIVGRGFVTPIFYEDPLYLLNLGILVLAAPCCVFYARRH